MVLGYATVQFLQLTGLVSLLGKIFAPLMGIFGLPGEAVIVLLSAFFAKAAGIAIAANMFVQGMLSASQVAILLMPCMLMGTLVEHYARIVLVAELIRTADIAAFCWTFPLLTPVSVCS